MSTLYSTAPAITITTFLTLSHIQRNFTSHPQNLSLAQPRTLHSHTVQHNSHDRLSSHAIGKDRHHQPDQHARLGNRAETKGVAEVTHTHTHTSASPQSPLPSGSSKTHPCPITSMEASHWLDPKNTSFERNRYVWLQGARILSPTCMKMCERVPNDQFPGTGSLCR